MGWNEQRVGAWPKRLVVGRRAFGSYLTGGLIWAQNAGRFEEAKRMGMAYLEAGQYDKAAGRLEEIWEQDQSDIEVAECLAMAYLNSEDRETLKRQEKAAFALMEISLREKGRASFLVHHSHEKMAWLQGREMNVYCSGKLSILGANLVYAATKGDKAKEHSFSVPVRNVSITLNENDRRGLFRLEAGNISYTMAPRNHNKAEAVFLVQTLQQRSSAR